MPKRRGLVNEASASVPPSPGQRLSRLPLGAFILLVHLGLTLTFPHDVLQDPGTGWHLKSGELILSEKSLAGTDPFTWTQADREWIQFEWLFDAFIAALNQLGGLTLVSAVMSFLFGLSVALLTGRLLAAGTHPYLALVVSLNVLVVIQWHALARPHVFTYLFLVISLWLLDRFRRTASMRALLPLIPMTLLWSNLHGGFVVLFLVLVIQAAATALEAWRQKDPAAKRRLGILMAAGVSVGLVSLINPYGWHLHLQIVHILGMECLTLWNEFKPPVLNGSNIHLLLFEGTLLGLLALAFAQGKRVPWADRIMALVFLHYAFQSVRHINLFMLVTAPALAFMLQSLLQHTLPGRAKSGEALARQQLRPRLWAGALATVFIVWTLGSQIRPGLYGSRMTEPYLSQDTIKYLRNHSGDFARSFNNNSLGGALIIHFYPEIRIFMDDRADLYGDRFVFDTYLPISKAETDWNDRLLKLGVDSLVLKSDDALARAAREHPEWKEVHRDSLNALFVHKNLERLDASGRRPEGE